MAAPRSHSRKDASNSSSSSDEERERLKEATWLPPGIKKCVQHQKDPDPPVTPSLRVRPDKHEHDGNELQTTPEFRAHVAKKLAAILDSCIKEIPGSSSLQEPEKEPDPEDEGFRLLSTSIPGDPGTVAPSSIPKRRAAYSSSEDSEEENERRCREAAVSGLEILKNSALYPVPVQSSDAPDNDQLTKKHKKKKKNKDKRPNGGSDMDHSGIGQDHESRKDKELDNENRSNQNDLRQEHETNGFKKKKKKNKPFVNETTSGL